MKKLFENPTMNISVFDMEDIVTASVPATTNAQDAQAAAAALMTANVGAKQINITF